ncbi:MAG: aminopeptidase N [Gammaproteobacteria bacterium]
MARDGEARTIRRQDYAPPAYRITDTALTFELADGTTRVASALTVVRAADTPPCAPLVLAGQDLQLVSVVVDGVPISTNGYRVQDETLTIHDLPAECVVEIVTDITPETNTALEGLYRSGGMYCTQCEAEGFRRITYYLDRPDVLARFRTTLIADGDRYPVLLSNGNLVQRDVLPDGRTRATWDDPFPKPAYLFALVAGDLALREDTFTTQSGRRVLLQIYSEPHNIEQVGYAMEALKRAMRWDETAYGREYDLERFMIVAVDDFNMGAMENKGLNLFNTSVVLATPDTATDSTYQRIEAIVAHEYFHNWSGNRVTCRDWFQLSLKEGFTVFRDEQFSGDMNSPTVRRIESVALLRATQFAEDASPLAHRVRPDSYEEISNFYTTTVYEKGAEVVGMLRTLLGPEAFRAGSDRYFATHDGSAATTDDFLAAMQAETTIDLTQFQRWYEQAGTPVVQVRTTWGDGDLLMHLTQSCPPTPGQPHKAPMLIPFRFGVQDGAGASVRPSAVAADDPVRADGQGGYLLELRSPTCEVRLRGVPQGSVLSVLRGFSAPVRLDFPRPAGDLALLAKHDPDGFARWDALQSLVVGELGQRMSGGAPDARLLDVFGELLDQALRAPPQAEALALLAAALRLPDENYLFEQFTPVDVGAIVDAREMLADSIAAAHADNWRRLYDALAHDGPYAPDPLAMARRALRHVAHRYWLRVADPVAGANSVRDQYRRADNLTDRRAALEEATRNLRLPAALADELLADVFARWSNETLVVNQWFQLQAASPRLDVTQLQALARHPAFDTRNPNKLRALYGGFAQFNHSRFHARDGSGYRFLAEAVRVLDRTNPQVAARLAVPLSRWGRLEPVRQRAMRQALAELARSEGLSRDLSEVATKGSAQI